MSHRHREGGGGGVGARAFSIFHIYFFESAEEIINNGLVRGSHEPRVPPRQWQEADPVQINDDISGL